MVYKICVLGAGVIGLTTAVNIQNSIPGVDVCIMADKFTTETLSDGAAGIFRPSNSIAGPDPHSIQKWLKDSYFYFKRIGKEEGEEAGVKEISGYLLSKKFKDITKSPLLEGLLPEWEIMSEKELKKFPGTWKFGVSFTTLLIECRRFLPWLTNSFVKSGGHIFQKHVNGFEELIGHYDIVVNCTGFGAKTLCNDQKLVPIRGQVLKITAPWVKHFYYGDYDTYIIPGFDYITLGGTRQYDSFNEEEDPYDTQSIWDRCCLLVPSLKHATIERKFVGLRPHRDPVRLESEEMNFGSNRLIVVHNYGHGGYGVTLSWGCAKEVAKIVKSLLKNKVARCQPKL